MIKKCVLCVVAGLLLSNCVFASDCDIVHKSVKFYEKQIQEDINNVCAFYNLANEYYLKKKFQKALNVYEDIINLYPTEENAYLKRANIYHKFRDNKYAEREIGKLAKNIPNSIEGNKRISEIYKNISDYEKAIQHIDKAIDLAQGKNNADLYYQKGDILYDMGKYEEAIESYKKCVNADAEYFNRVCYDLWRCYEGLGNTVKAEEYRTKWFYSPIGDRNLAQNIKWKISRIKSKIIHDDLY